MWRVMMKFIHVAVAVLSFLSVGQSAPVSSCESLIQKIKISGREPMLGKWTFIAESINFPAAKMLTEMFIESARGEVTAGNESDAINIFQSQKMFGSCFTVTTQMTVVNSTLFSVKPFIGSGVLLRTGCPDCLVLFLNYTMGGRTFSGLQLMSRRTSVTPAELQEFTKQVTCVNLPEPAILNPEKGFCPDESPSQETDAIDLTKYFSDMGSEIFNVYDSIIKSENGFQTLAKMISSGIAELKEN